MGDAMSESEDSADKELEMLSIIRLQIKSEVPDVIDGDCTIPYPIPVKLSWLEVFRMLQIRFDPEQHLLKAHGSVIQDLSTLVYVYYKQYKTSRATYLAKIIPKESKKPKERRNAKPPLTKPSSPSKKTQAKNAEEKRQTRSQQQRQDAGKSKPRTSIKCSKPPTIQLQRMGNTSSDRFTPSPMINQEIMEERNGTSFRFQPPLLVAHRPIDRSSAGPSGYSQFSEQPRLAFRDESTMAGEIRRPEEDILKPTILKYLSDHCSNRDMLEIRNELTGLRRAMKFQALNRLIPFTAGILSNAFYPEQ